MKLYQKIFAVIFMVALMGFAILNASVNFHSMKIEFSEIEKPQELDEVKAFTAEVDNLTSNNLLFDHAWNEAYAMVYNTLGKNEENSFKYVRDKNGMLYGGNFWNTTEVPSSKYVKRINVIRKKVEDKGTKVVVLLYPSQYNEQWTDGYKGIPYSDYNKLYDELAAYFRYYSIDFIDYRAYFMENEWEAEEIFYKTDHHWTTMASFVGYQKMVEYLNEEFDANLDTYYTDINNYEMTIYEDSFIGSQGRDAGLSYVGLDDFTLLTPKFQNEYIFGIINKDNEWKEKQGVALKTLFDFSYLEESDYYEKDLYSVYMGGIHIRERITNLDNEEGLNVLFIRDSYASPVGVFFAPHCNQMDFLWSANNDAEVIENTIETGHYDYIFISLSVDSFANGGFEIYVDEELINE